MRATCLRGKNFNNNGLEMKHGSGSRRQRNRGNNNGRRGNQQRTQVYDSNGPDVRIRGTAHQVAEKYLALAKDAASAGDRIMAENYFQHAEHYIRMINEANGTFDMSRVVGLENDANDNEGEESGSVQKAARPNRVAQAAAVEDLGLPSSILGQQTAAGKATETAD